MQLGKSISEYLQKQTRISLNYLFDEFVLDPDIHKIGKEHGKAYSLKHVFPFSFKLTNQN